MSTYKSKVKSKRTPLPRMPQAESISVIQFQLFDNGENPGKGRSQWVASLEVYGQGRLDLLDPYWKRAVSLIDPAKVMAWADKARDEGRMTDAIHQTYVDAQAIAAEFASSDVCDWVRMGHIGSKADHIYYEGQFILVMKQIDGPIGCVVFIDGEPLTTNSFLFDKKWRPGGSRRKFFGFYDPHGAYQAMKRERAMIAEADALAAARAMAEPGDVGLENQFRGFAARSPF
jgi:hypothetical protein